MTDIKDPEEMKIPKENLYKKPEIPGKTNMRDEDTVLCMQCHKRFANITDIHYLQECMHTICKEDLKKLIFQ